MNIVFSDLAALVECDDRDFFHKAIELNQIGETIAQDEYERRFDRIFSKYLNVISIAAAVAAVIISGIGLL